MKRSNRLTGVFLIVTVFSMFLLSCPMEMESPMLQDIKDIVEEYNQGLMPDIEITEQETGTVIPDGGTSGAFAGAVQNVPMDVVYMITNTGGSLLTLSESSTVEISGSEAGLFSVLSPPASMAVGPGESTVFTIRGVLSAPGTATAQLSVYSDDPDENPYDFTVSNTALPEIQVLQDTTSIESATGSHDFGIVEYGQAKDVVFIIQNLGTADLDLTGTDPVTVTGTGYSVLEQPVSPVIPGAESTFTVRLTPESPGLCGGSVSIASSDADESPFTFTTPGDCRMARSNTRMAGGMFHTVALKSNGTVWTWGRNQYGQLGDGSEENRPYPDQVPGINGAASIASGLGHTIALMDDGTVWTWGYNVSGQLGNGNTTNSLSPVEIPGITDVVQVDGGAHHTIALKSDGTVWTWGRNTYGQLGYPTEPKGVDDYEDNLTPGQIPDLSGVIAVASGGFHGIALKSDGTVWTWGQNNNGQLGNEDNMYTDSNVPVQVVDMSNVTAIAGGWYHTMMLDSENKVWTCGQNDSGQLGNTGAGSESNIPVQASDLSDVSDITAGWYHSLALKSDGTVEAWGRSYATTPAPVPDLSDIEALGSGNDFSLALDSDGTVLAWGMNHYGNLGDYTSTHRDTPEPALSFSMRDVTAVAAGLYYTVALKSNGEVWTWGDNSHGQLGDGTTMESAMPIRVTGVSNATAVAAGAYHTLATDGTTVWTWGENDYGQLGDGTTTDSNTPVALSVFSGVIFDLAAGFSHSVALDNADPDWKVWTWGDNEYGQLGDGGELPGTDSLVPTPNSSLSGLSRAAAGNYHTVVLGGGSAWSCGRNDKGQLWSGNTTDNSTFQHNFFGTDIAAGASHTVSLQADATVDCCGYNGYGQLGDGTYMDSSFTVTVSGLSDIDYIAAGGAHTVAVDYFNHVWAWGWNGSGQLGIDSTVDKFNTPQQVPDFNDADIIAAGGSHTVAVKTDGSVWTWGNNLYGQLGTESTENSLVPVHVCRPFTLW